MLGFHPVGRGLRCGSGGAACSRAHCIVLPVPLLNQDSRFGQRFKEFAVQQLGVPLLNGSEVHVGIWPSDAAPFLYHLGRYFSAVWAFWGT